MLRIVAVFLLLGVSSAVNAEDLQVKYSGYVDTYYAQTSAHPSDADRYNGISNTQPIYNQPVYDDAFSLGMARLNIEGNLKPANFRIDLGYGDNASLLNGQSGFLATPTTVTRNSLQVLQGYLTYNFGNTTIDAGKMYGHVGLEAVDNVDNFNYTRSYSWYNLPPLHTGLRVKQAFSEGKHVLGLYLYNSSQIRAADLEDNQSKGMGASFSTTVVENLTVYVSYLSSKDAVTATSHSTFTFSNINLTYALTGKWTLAADYMKREVDPESGIKTELSTLGGYVSYKATDALTFNVRYETMDDSDGSNSLGHAVETRYKIQSTTATVVYQLTPNLQTRGEYRMDTADKDIFFGGEQTAKDKQDMAIVAAILKF